MSARIGPSVQMTKLINLQNTHGVNMKSSARTVYPYKCASTVPQHLLQQTEPQKSRLNFNFSLHYLSETGKTILFEERNKAGAVL